MPTANERKALWFLAVVALSGSAVRLWRANAGPPTSSESAGLVQQIQRVDSAAAARLNRAAGPRKARKGAAAETKTERPPVAAQIQPPFRVPELTPPIDLDRATQAEIESLPGIGPALAKRIVDRRDSSGAFGGFGALCEVRGVGPALAERLRPLVTFTGPRRPLSDTCAGALKKPRKTPVARDRKPR